MRGEVKHSRTIQIPLGSADLRLGAPLNEESCLESLIKPHVGNVKCSSIVRSPHPPYSEVAIEG